MGYPKRHIDRREQTEVLDRHPKKHFVMYSTDTINVGSDPLSPTYLTGLMVLPTQTGPFTLITNTAGEQWLRNDTGRVLNMAGTLTYQLVNGSGGTATLNIWAEVSADDGETPIVVNNSLRNSEIKNEGQTSQTKVASIVGWNPGECARFAFYNSGGGTISFAQPSATVNGSDVVTGFSFVHQLREV